jgi:putative flippase GtrA
MFKDAKGSIKRYSIFWLGGVSVFLFELLLTVMLAEAFSLAFPIAFAVSLGVGMFFLYLYHSRITFSGSRRKNRHVLFFLSCIFSNVVFWFLSQMIHLFVSIYYPFAIGVAAIPISLINFNVSRHLIFRG